MKFYNQPNEIISLIINYCDVETIKSLRTTCKVYKNLYEKQLSLLNNIDNEIIQNYFLHEKINPERDIFYQICEKIHKEDKLLTKHMIIIRSIFYSHCTNFYPVLQYSIIYCIKLIGKKHEYILKKILSFLKWNDPNIVEKINYQPVSEDDMWDYIWSLKIDEE